MPACSALLATWHPSCRPNCSPALPCGLTYTCLGQPLPCPYPLAVPPLAICSLLLLVLPPALSAGEHQAQVLRELERGYNAGLRRQLGGNRTVGLGL
jgi:hypothetical protein